MLNIKKKGMVMIYTVYVGMRSPKELGELFDDNKDIFDSSKIIAFSRSNAFPADNLVELKKSHTFSEAIYNTIKSYIKKDVLIQKLRLYY
jgi:hypothetical protein